MQNVVLSISKVSEHDNQPELDHELLPQYVIDTREHDDNVRFLRNNILQYENAIGNMSSAEVRGRKDTRHPPSPSMVNPTDHLLGDNHNILGILSQLEGMMVTYSCLLKTISY